MAKAIAEYAVRIGTGGSKEQVNQASFQFGSSESGFEIEQLSADEGIPFGTFPADDGGDNLDDMEFGRESMRVGKTDQKSNLLAFGDRAKQGQVKSKTPLWEAYKQKHGIV